MAEYNFWDDRTYSSCDDYYCPIIDTYCLDQDCDNCSDFKEYCKFYNLEDEELNK